METLELVLLAFFSGVVGSSIGALGAVILTAIVCLVGIVAAAAGSSYDFIGQIAFGMFLGPHVSFGPACCAAGYAKFKGYIQSSKDVATPLISIRKPTVLVVGGLFAVFGWFFNSFLAEIFVGGIDTIAWTIVIMSIGARIIFAESKSDAFFGKPSIETINNGGRFCPMCNELWIPYQSKGMDHVMFGAGIGATSAYMAYTMLEVAQETGNAALAAAATLPGWCLAMTVFFINLAGKKTPVFHHICMVGAVAAKGAFLGGNSLLICILWGCTFSILSSYLADFLARVIMVHGEGFVDPPSMAIAVLSIFLLGVFPQFEMFNYNNILAIIIPLVILSLILILAYWQEKVYTNHCNTSA